MKSRAQHGRILVGLVVAVATACSNGSSTSPGWGGPISGTPQTSSGNPFTTAPSNPANPFATSDENGNAVKVDNLAKCIASLKETGCDTIKNPPTCRSQIASLPASCDLTEYFNCFQTGIDCSSGVARVDWEILKSCVVPTECEGFMPQSPPSDGGSSPPSLPDAGMSPGFQPDGGP